MNKSPAQTRHGQKRSGQTVIGWREVVGLPALGVLTIKAKIDTGARTTALNVTDVETTEQDSRAAFLIPGPNGPVRASAPVVDRRAIKNTSGIPQTRWIIKTMLLFGSQRWTVEISLADRAEMDFDMIVGRTAIRGRGFVVDPGRSFLLDPPRV